MKLYPTAIADTGLFEVQFRIDKNYSDKLKAIFEAKQYVVDKIGNSLFINSHNQNTISEQKVHEICEVIKPYMGDHLSYISIVYR